MVAVAEAVLMAAKDAVDKVANVADTIKESSGGVVEAKVDPAVEDGENAVKVVVSVKAAKNLDLAEDSKDKKAVVSAVTKVVSTVVSEAEGDATVKIDGVKLPTNSYPVDKLDEDKIKELANKYVTPANYNAASKATITVMVNGVAVTYHISLK